MKDRCVILPYERGHSKLIDIWHTIKILTAEVFDLPVANQT